ncbi:MAG: sulfite exporter TauE/SafE family protein [Alphaproteobacteria bacterium]|nr:sulfite exporter TauE/SafE family protein [Alphaproteobacteria bacterium]
MPWLDPLYDLAFGQASPWVVLGAAAMAGLLRGFAGFGSAMLLAPIFVGLFGAAEMLVTILAMESLISAPLVVETRREADWPLVRRMAVAATLAMPLGLWFLTAVDSAVVGRTVSAVVIAFALAMLAGWRWGGGHSPARAAVAGALSGALWGGTGIGGPPVLVYLLSSPDPPARLRANIIAYFTVVQVALIVMLLATQIVGMAAVWRGAILFPAMWATAALGARLFRGSDEARYRRIALTILLGVGVFGLLR